MTSQETMDLYTGCLLLGGVGLAAMGLAGLSHGSHAHSHGGARGHLRGGHQPGSHGARAGQSAAHHAHGGGSLRTSVSDAALALLSPRLLFSFLLGFGLAGMLLRSLLSGPLLLVVSLVCGLLFERLLMAPLWNLLLRFASNPAVTLESCVTDEATAVTAFDKNGQGLISVEVDGQVVQVLGTLTRDALTAGRKVKAGDLVRIEEVDSARHRCVVSVP